MKLRTSSGSGMPELRLSCISRDTSSPTPGWPPTCRWMVRGWEGWARLQTCGARSSGEVFNEETRSLARADAELTALDAEARKAARATEPGGHTLPADMLITDFAVLSASRSAGSSGDDTRIGARCGHRMLVRSLAGGADGSLARPTLDASRVRRCAATFGAAAREIEG